MLSTAITKHSPTKYTDDHQQTDRFSRADQCFSLPDPKQMTTVWSTQAHVSMLFDFSSVPIPQVWTNWQSLRPRVLVVSTCAVIVHFPLTHLLFLCEFVSCQSTGMKSGQLLRLLQSTRFSWEHDLLLTKISPLWYTIRKVNTTHYHLDWSLSDHGKKANMRGK